MISDPKKLLETILLFDESNIKKTSSSSKVTLEVQSNGVVITTTKDAWEEIEPKLVEVEAGLFSLFGTNGSASSNKPVIESFEMTPEWVERETSQSFPNEINHSKKIFNLFITTACTIRAKSNSGTELRWVRALSPIGSLLNESYDDFSEEDHDEPRLRKKYGNSTQVRFKNGAQLKVELEVTAESLERNPAGGVKNRKAYKTTKKKNLIIPPPPKG